MLQQLNVLNHHCFYLSLQCLHLLNLMWGFSGNGFRSFSNHLFDTDPELSFHICTAVKCFKFKRIGSPSRDFFQSIALPSSPLCQLHACLLEHGINAYASTCTRLGINLQAHWSEHAPYATTYSELSCLPLGASHPIVMPPKFCK